MSDWLPFGLTLAEFLGQRHSVAHLLFRYLFGERRLTLVVSNTMFLTRFLVSGF
jgi:hypothetical protein